MTTDVSTGSVDTRPLAVVTGASSGIGLALAREFAEHGFDLIVAAEDSSIESAPAALGEGSGEVTAVVADLATYEGVEQLTAAIASAGRPVEALALNAGIGTSGRFVDADLDHELALLQLNVISPVHLAKRVLPAMVNAGSGRVLITSSIAATMPGPFEATYAASKAFLQSFAQAIRHELKDTGVTVTALMPGPTDTEFFDRAGLENTKIGQGPKDDPVEVAKQGFEALMSGDDHVVAGAMKNRLQATAAKGMPQTVSAAGHARLSKPRTDESSEDGTTQ